MNELNAILTAPTASTRLSRRGRKKVVDDILKRLPRKNHPDLKGRKLVDTTDCFVGHSLTIHQMLYLLEGMEAVDMQRDERHRGQHSGSRQVRGRRQHVRREGQDHRVGEDRCLHACRRHH